MDPVERELAALRCFVPLSESNVEAFLSAVAAVTSSGDRRTVRPVLLLVDQRCSLAGVMDQVLSLLERVPVSEFLEEFLKVLPEFNRTNPMYAESELKKHLWSEEHRLSLVSSVRGLSADEARAVRAVLDRVDSPRLAPAVREVRDALQGNR